MLIDASLVKAIVGTRPDGSDGAKSIGQLMANPATRQAYYGMTPDGQLAVQNMFSKSSDDVNKWTPQSLQLYHKLVGMAADQPQDFAGADLSSLYGKIPTQTLVQLTQQQGAISKHDNSQADRQLQWTRTKGDVNDMLTPLGLGSAAPLHDADKQSTNQQFYGQLQGAMEQYHQQFQKYPDTVTTRKIAAGLLVQGTQTTPGTFFDSHDTIPVFRSKDRSNFQPPKNADGWTLMSDKSGNQAYVSPDGKQFKAAP